MHPQKNKKSECHYIAKGIPLENLNKDKGIVIGIISIICAIISLIFYPIIFGGFGIFFGIVSVNKGSSKLGIIGVILSAVFMTLGLLIGFMLFAVKL